MKAESTIREVPGQGLREVMQVVMKPQDSARFHMRPLTDQMEALTHAGLDVHHTLGLFMTNDSEGRVYYFTASE